MRLNVTLYAYCMFCLVLNPVIYIYIYIYMSVCVCVCVYIYMHTHTHTHTQSKRGMQWRSWLMSWVRIPVVSLELFIDITLPAALFVWGVNVADAWG